MIYISTQHSTRESATPTSSSTSRHWLVKHFTVHTRTVQLQTRLQIFRSACYWFVERRRRMYNVLQLNSSLPSMQSRWPSQRLHRDLHSPEPQRNCVAVSHTKHTHTHSQSHVLIHQYVILHISDNKKHSCRIEAAWLCLSVVSFNTDIKSPSAHNCRLEAYIALTFWDEKSIFPE